MHDRLEIKDTVEVVTAPLFVLVDALLEARMYFATGS